MSDPTPLGNLTRLLRRPDASWRLSVCPSAGEAGGSLVSSIRQQPEYVRPGAGADPTRARTEAGRRARGQVRRYCAANGLNRLGTLTYSAPFCRDPLQLRSDVAGFFRALRVGLGGDPLPYLWVGEWHADHERLHAHFAVGRYVRRGLIENAWGRGFVHIKRLSDLPSGASNIVEARRAASYLAKYVTKTFDASQGLAGLHRYEVAQGFQPLRVPVLGRSAAEVHDLACALFGGALPARSWSSSDVDDWAGPPAVWFQWD